MIVFFSKGFIVQRLFIICTRARFTKTVPLTSLDNLRTL
jgi:hypothetical protein